MNIHQTEEAMALAPVVAQSQTAADVSPAIVVQYVPALGSGGSAATCKYTSDGFGFTVDSTTPSGKDYIGSSTGWLVVATYTNMGQIVDAINGAGAWRAYLVAARRGDASADVLAQAAASCIGDNGLTFYWDTSAYDGCAMAISGEKFVNNGINGHVKDADDECLNMLLHLSVTMASDGTLKFYSSSQSADTQLSPSYTCGSATEVEIGEESVAEPWIVANRGERLLIIVDAATAANGTPTSFRATGKTAVLSGDRIVDEVNF